MMLHTNMEVQPPPLLSLRGGDAVSGPRERAGKQTLIKLERLLRRYAPRNDKLRVTKVNNFSWHDKLSCF
jgi:hypothetical protein